MQSAQLYSRRDAKTSSSNQEGWRNSKATARSVGKIDKKFFNVSKFFRRYGGSWKRTAPLVEPNIVSARKRYSTSLAASLSRFTWVIFCGALRTKRNSAGTCAAHVCSTLSFGSR